MVVGVVSDLLQIVVLARDAQTFLRVGRTWYLREHCPERCPLNWFVPALVNISGVALHDHRAEGTIMALRLKCREKPDNFIRLMYIDLSYFTFLISVCKITHLN